jgi:hypothetical protein
MSELLHNKEKSVQKILVDVGAVVKSHINNLMHRVDEENKTIQSTIDFLNEMPLVKKLRNELIEAKMEIIRLRKLLDDKDCSIKLETSEVNEGENMTISYDEINNLVSDKIIEKESKSKIDFLSYLMKQNDNTEETQHCDEEEDIIEDDCDYDEEEKNMSDSNTSTFHGLTVDTSIKFDLDGAESDKQVAKILEETQVQSNDKQDSDAQKDEDFDEQEDEVSEEQDEEVSEEQDEEVSEEQEEVVSEEQEEVVSEEEDEVVSEEQENEVSEEEEEESSGNQENISEEEEELEVDEVKINGKLFFTTNEKNGVIFDMDEDGDIGDEIGYFKNGKAFFS